MCDWLYIHTRAYVNGGMGDESAYLEPHDVTVVRGTGGFGFNIKGTTQEGGKHMAINGRLYAPLQYVSLIDENGAAWDAGLRVWDRILAVNGHDVEGASHKQVVDHVLSGGGTLRLRVVSVRPEEADRLQRIEDALDTQAASKGSKRYRVAVQGHYTVDQLSSKAYTVFNIYLDGDYVTSRRYSEFVTLHKRLKNRFRWFSFPPLPGKKLNGLLGGAVNRSGLEAREEGLREYLGPTMETEEIFNFEATREFLRPSAVKPPGIKSAAAAAAAGGGGGSKANSAAATPPRSVGPPVASASRDLMKAANQLPSARPPPTAGRVARPAAPKIPVLAVRVTMPNHQTLAFDVPETEATVGGAQEKLLTLLQLTPAAKNVFQLFEAVDMAGVPVPKPSPGDVGLFERPVDPATDLSDVKGRLVLRRWLFTKSQEALLQEDASFVKVLAEQVELDIKTGRLVVQDSRKAAFEELAQSGDRLKYIKTARKLRAYNRVRFPKCTSNFPAEDTDVVVTVDSGMVIIQELDEDGDPSTEEDAVTSFGLDIITRVARKGTTIGFQYSADDGSTENVKFSTPHAAFLEACLRRIKQEAIWAASPGKGLGNWFQSEAI